MLPIGYFLLLLFCISTNMTHSMEEEQPKPVDKAATMLLALKGPTSLNPIQKLPSPIKTTDPDNYKFTLNCPSCKKKFATTRESDLKFDFKNHCESICQLTKEKIDQALKKIVEPKKILNFTMPCPFKECTFIQKTNRKKNELRSRLLQHVDSKIHSDNPEKTKKRKLIEPKASFKEYFKQFGTTDSIPNPNFIPNPTPRNTDNLADCKFTLKCPSCKKNITTFRKASLKFNFKRHYELICPLTRKLICPLTKEEINLALEEIVEPKNIRTFIASCPVKECELIPKAKEISKLKSKLLAHIDSRIHSDNPEKTKKRKLIETKKSFKKYFNKFGTTDSIPNPNKKRKLQHSNNC